MGLDDHLGTSTNYEKNMKIEMLQKNLHFQQQVPFLPLVNCVLKAEN
jgi:hypothetical protein